MVWSSVHETEALPMIIKDQKLLNIISYIRATYGCHTFILYGSRARGDETYASDYDLIAIRDDGDMQRHCELFENDFIDAFIYSEKAIENPDDSFMRIKDGIVIYQKEDLGNQLLHKVKEKYSQGPKKISQLERQVITTWSNKMLKRAATEDIDGNYRRHWLLFDLLEAYFHLRDKWYLGPKESFQWLKSNDPTTYSLFDISLRPEASLSNIHALVDKVISA